MAIGTAMAIGLGATALGKTLAGKSQNKAVKKAAGISDQNRVENNALAGQVYQQTSNALAPYAQQGNPAGTQINAMLGLGGQPAQTAGFDQFRNSTGYQFRRDEGMNALNSGYAGAGVLQSGAAMRGAQEYGQNFASNEYSNYMGLLDNQQRLGLSATMGQAGLGQSYVGGITANNNNASTDQANAALMRSQSNPFASVLGGLGGTLMSGGIKF
jgi:hypothetical protein